MKKNLALFLVTLCLQSLAQKTPEALGELTFAYLKANNFSGFDTLTPSATQAIGIFKTKYPSVVKDSTDFAKKYQHNDKRFKQICYDLRNDTHSVLPNKPINWATATLTKVQFTEEPVKKGQQVMFTTNYLDLHITSDNQKYVLRFKEIYFYNNLYKLGESVSPRPK